MLRALQVRGLSATIQRVIRHLKEDRETVRHTRILCAPVASAVHGRVP